MSLNAAEIFVILVYRAAWFLGHATLAYILWNFVVSNVFDLAELGYVDAVTTYALLRLVVDPAKLTITMD